MTKPQTKIICFPDVRYSEEFVARAVANGADLTLAGKLKWIEKSDKNQNLPRIIVEDLGNHEHVLMVLRHSLGERLGETTVVSFSEKNVLMTAFLNQALGGCGNTPTTAELVRHKYKMKVVIERAGIPTPGYSMLNDIAGLKKLSTSEGRIVLKPVDGWASQGVRVFESLEKLLNSQAQEVKEAKQNPDGYMLEQFIDAEMYHVDGVVRHGEVIRSYVGHYGRPLFGIGTRKGANFLDCILHDDGILVKRLREAHKRVVQALGITFGATHVEFFVEKSTSRILFCEAAGRSPGNGIIKLHEIACGMSTMALLADIACKKEIPILPKVQRCAALICINSPSGRILQMDDLSAYADWPEVFSTEVVARVGDQIVSNEYLSEIARVYLTGDSEAACWKTSGTIENNFRYELGASQ